MKEPGSSSGTTDPIITHPRRTPTQITSINTEEHARFWPGSRIYPTLGVSLLPNDIIRQIFAAQAHLDNIGARFELGEFRIPAAPPGIPAPTLRGCLTTEHLLELIKDPSGPHPLSVMRDHSWRHGGALPGGGGGGGWPVLYADLSAIRPILRVVRIDHDYARRPLEYMRDRLVTAVEATTETYIGVDVDQMWVWWHFAVQSSGAITAGMRTRLTEENVGAVMELLVSHNGRSMLVVRL